jgi:hypothetical protein
LNQFDRISLPAELAGAGGFQFSDGMLVQVAKMIEAGGLQVDFLRLDFRKGRFGQNFGGNILDRRARNFVI